MSQITDTIKLLFSRKWWWVTLLVIALMALLFRLGIWQLDRLDERRAANAELMAVLSSPPLELAETDLPADPTPLLDRQVTATGTYDFDEQVLIKLQMWNGQPGIWLVAPLVLEGNSAVLVNRGWLPDAESDPAAWAAYDQAGEVTVAGYVGLTEIISRQTNASAETTPGEFYRIDIDAIDAQMPYDLLPIVVHETPDDSAEQTLPFKAEQEIDLSEGPHMSYAIQWFIFCIGLGVAYVIFVRHSTKKANAAAPAEAAAGAVVEKDTDSHDPISA